MDPTPYVTHLGDSGLVVTFGDTISPATHKHVTAFAKACEELSPSGITDVVPTYTSVAIYIDLHVIDISALREKLISLLDKGHLQKTFHSREIEIPVIYGGDSGPDLIELAQNAHLSVEEVIDLHCSVEYHVYMLGFSPGFPYLGIVPETIALPRLSEPRLHVPAGSVGIAGQQTGIYPQDSPGGWRIIGQTPLQLYNRAGKDPFLLQAGDRIRFRSITLKEFERLQE